MQTAIGDVGGGYAIGCNGNDGTIDLVIAGGTGQYTTSWNGPGGFGSLAEHINGLGVGTYTVVVSDANGCSSQADITLDGPAPMDASFSIAPADCSGDPSGAVDLTILGGAAPLNIIWTGPGGFSSTNEDISGLEAGDYDVIVTDAAGCTRTFNTELSEPAPIQSGTYVSFYGLYNVQCQGDSTGVIELEPAGGTGPYAVLVN
ncbi:MAG TPA: hypothetical protein VKG92_12065, partial [Flavobacteriales bacterium]|nr:hypothetical protein [Flavobacteriales bacterium]